MENDFEILRACFNFQVFNAPYTWSSEPVSFLSSTNLRTPDQSMLSMGETKVAKDSNTGNANPASEVITVDLFTCMEGSRPCLGCTGKSGEFNKKFVIK